MAQPINCDTGDGEPAVFLITNLDSGQVVSYCSGCLVGFGFTLAKEAMGAEGMLAQLGPIHVAKAPAKGKGKARSAEPKSAPPEGPPPTQTADPESGAPQEPAAADGG